MVWGLGDRKCPQDDPVSKVLDPALQSLAAVPCKEAREVLQGCQAKAYRLTTLENHGEIRNIPTVAILPVLFRQA